MMPHISASHSGTSASRCGTSAEDALIEVAFLLPPDRVEALVHLARSSRRTVAQVLRSLIDGALATSAN